VGTHGMAMVIQHGIKVIAFSTLNVSLMEYWPLLLGIGVATLAGNLLGAKLLARVPEDKFTIILNWLLTALALRLMYQGLNALLTTGN